MSVSKKKTIIVIILITFVISLIGTIKSLPGQFNNFIDWITLGIHILIIGHLTKLLHPSYTSTIKRTTVVLTLFSVYMSLGTGLLHYQGEGGYRSDLLQSNVGNEIQYYYIELHNGLKLPLNLDLTLLYGERGIENITTVLSKTNEQVTKDDKMVNLTFTVTETEPTLPTKAVVTYRIFGVIPMINVMELKWPKFSSY